LDSGEEALRVALQVEGVVVVEEALFGYLGVEL
jgi:hypothetical protein